MRSCRQSGHKQVAAPSVSGMVAMWGSPKHQHSLSPAAIPQTNAAPQRGHIRCPFAVSAGLDACPVSVITEV